MSLGGEYINLRLLHPETYIALTHICEQRDWAEMESDISQDVAAWLCFQLELVPDTEETFPKGKWATIQRLQALVREAVAEDAARKVTP